MKKICALFLIISIAVSFVGCGSSAKAVVGKWYNNRGKCLDIRADGTWKLEDSYGTGRWKKLDGGIFEFIDFYGDTQESAINKDELGSYIDFGYYGDFYKNAFPNVNEIGSEALFKDIHLVSKQDASPYCIVEVDTSNCADFLQKNVSYTVDSDRHKKGDTITVSAAMMGSPTEKVKKEFLLEDVPVYLDSLTENQKEILLNKMNQYIEEQLTEYKLTGKAFNNSLLMDRNTKVQKTYPIGIGFFRLTDEFSEEHKHGYAYNCFYGVYGIDILDENNKSATRTVEVFFPSIAANGEELLWCVSAGNKNNYNEIKSAMYPSFGDFQYYSSLRRTYVKSGYYTHTEFNVNK